MLHECVLSALGLQTRNTTHLLYALSVAGRQPVRSPSRHHEMPAHPEYRGIYRQLAKENARIHKGQNSGWRNETV